MATEGVLPGRSAPAFGEREARGGSARARLLAAMGRDVDAASAGLFRIAFGTLIVVAVARTLAHGWVEQHFEAPRMFFPYHGFEWVRPWPKPGMTLHFVVMGVAALGVALGAFQRLSATVLFFTFTYAHLVDRTYYLNHYYFVSLLAFLSAVLPVGRALSIDAWRKGGEAPGRVPEWTVWALRLQVGLVYFYAGVAKLEPDWLLHGQPMRLWLGARTDHPLFGHLAGARWAGIGLSWAGAIFDLAVPFLLVCRRTRAFAFAVLVVFHAATGSLFQIGIFPWLMCIGALVFFEPSWPRQLLHRVLGGPLQTPASPAPASLALRALPHPALAAVLVAYFLAQILVPLRSHLHPGSVLWTEEGFRFSFRVMLMDKSGVVDFVVEDPATGKSYTVSPREYLTPGQERMMATQPDMILTLAHQIGREFEARGIRSPVVRVDSFVSLNGRAPTRFVDPAADLYREHESFHSKPWLLPPPEGPPP